MKLKSLLLIVFSSISVIVMAFATSIFSSLLDFIRTIVFGNEIYLTKLVILLTSSTILIAIIEDILRIVIIGAGCARLSFSTKEMCYAVGSAMAFIEIVSRLPNDLRFFIVLGDGGIYSYIGAILLFTISIFKIILHILLCKIEYINFLRKRYYVVFVVILFHGVINSLMYFTPSISQMVISGQSKLDTGITTLLSYIFLYGIFLIFIKYIENDLPSYESISNENR